MSGTLERLGSIRRSLRHPKKLLVNPVLAQRQGKHVHSSMPDKVEQAGVSKGDMNRTYFVISVEDATVSINESYR